MKTKYFATCFLFPLSFFYPLLEKTFLPRETNIFMSSTSSMGPFGFIVLVPSLFLRMDEKKFGEILQRFMDLCKGL
jgi:hypothetical protein